ncbi:MAG: S8 family serine peptidase, partial [Crocinitomicaceae bacterium]
MHKYILLSFCLILVAAVNAQVKMPANTSADIIEIKQLTGLKSDLITENVRKRFPIDKIGASDFVAFITKKSSVYNKANLIANGIMIGAEIGDIVTVKYPFEILESIKTDQNFEYIELAGMVKPTLDRVPWDVRADSVWAGYGMPNGFSGDEVIIGVQDWGFDYTSPMFYDTTLSNSRILAAWDQFKTSGPAPASYGYGTEYSNFSELQAAGADTANIYSYATHGTHVAGIAGGSGA